jgi:two-component system sensor histidine kinase PhoQ
MDQIVQHQLRRAAASGRTALGRALEVPSLVERLARSLAKVYRDKGIAFDLAARPDSRFFGDEADLMEVLGNLMDNACKYGQRRVRVTTVPYQDGPRPGLELRVEDDGIGIPQEQGDEVMQRGWRRDQSVPDQGLGLSVVREILGVYGGDIHIQTSDLGGACVRVRFPPV